MSSRPEFLIAQPVKAQTLCIKWQTWETHLWLSSPKALQSFLHLSLHPHRPSPYCTGLASLAMLQGKRVLDLGSHDSRGAAKLLALCQKGELRVTGSCLCRFSFRTALARLRADTWVKKVKTITNILGLRSQELLNYTLHCVITVFGLVSCSPAPAASPGVACRNLRSAKGLPCAVRFPGLDRQWGDLAENCHQS